MCTFVYRRKLYKLMYICIKCRSLVFARRWKYGFYFDNKIFDKSVPLPNFAVFLPRRPRCPSLWPRRGRRQQPQSLFFPPSFGGPLLGWKAPFFNHQRLVIRGRG